MSVSKLKRAAHKGFTLVELTIGITVLSIALLIMTGALFPQIEKSTDPWFQVRSAELAHSMMNEILARRFDENSLVQGNLRCGEYETGSVSTVPCATQTELDSCSTTEETSRDLYDDVDDYNCLAIPGNLITDMTGLHSLSTAYAQFNISVSVNYAGAAKLITVTVVPPRGASVVYSTYKANY